MTRGQSSPTQATRSLKAVEAPLDPAHQSLADALRTSFRLLKLAMIVLVILFFTSGAFVVDQNEQAVVLRLGRPLSGVRGPGAHWAFPYPIDEVIKLPVKQSNTLAIKSHWLHLYESEIGKPLDDIQRGNQGLHPMRDGSLLTGDKGLVHVQWRVTYHITDLEQYVRLVSDSNLKKAESIITKLLEKSAIHVVSGYTTEDATRKRLAEMRSEVKAMVNDELDRLGIGVTVESVEIPESTPPVQTRLAFAEVIRAENKKRTLIREAEKKATDILNQTAGASYKRMLELLDDLDKANDKQAQPLLAELNHIIEVEASGKVGSMIREANGYYTSVVQRMRGDAEEYQTLIDEYRTRPELLTARLWQETRQKLLSNDEITKIYVPPDMRLRLHVGPDPKQRERRERLKYMRDQNQGSQSIQRHEHRPMEEKFPGGKPV